MSDGFYWIRDWVSKEWSIAEYREGQWFFLGSHDTYYEVDDVLLDYWIGPRIDTPNPETPTDARN